MSAKPRVGLVTCADVGAGALDDLPYEEALREGGAVVDKPVWNDPKVDWAGFDAIQIRTTWDYHPQRDAFVAWARRAESHTQVFNPAEMLAWNTDKLYMRELAEAGVPIVPTLWIDQVPAAGENFEELVRAQTSERLFLKPTVGANADGTLRFSPSESGIAEAAAHLKQWREHSAMMLQPYLPSVEAFGELSLIYIDGEPSHAVRKVPKAGDFRVQDDHGASDFPHALDPALRAFGAKTLDALSPRLGPTPLYARVDIMTGPAGELWLGELELIEPSIFFRHAPSAAARMAEALLARLT